MPDRFYSLLQGVAGTWDGLLLALASSPVLPRINSTHKAFVLVISAVTAIFGAGVGFALFLSGFQGLPQRVAALEETTSRTAEYVCEIRYSLMGGNPLLCYREEP